MTVQTHSGALLEGFRIVAIAVNLPGPLAAARLRALGASVMKIEPLRGDPLADAAPAWYEQIVAGMEIVQFDLHAPEAKALVDERLRDADLLLTAMRPRALENIELDWPALHARYRQLCSVALIGEPAPDDERPGHDLTYQARAGTIVPPALPRVLVGDMAAAERTATVALALLLQRASRRWRSPTLRAILPRRTCTDSRKTAGYSVADCLRTVSTRRAKAGSRLPRWNRTLPSVCRPCLESSASTSS